MALKESLEAIATCHPVGASLLAKTLREQARSYNGIPTLMENLG
jgi:hypothetical protein